MDILAGFCENIASRKVLAPLFYYEIEKKFGPSYFYVKKSLPLKKKSKSKIIKIKNQKKNQNKKSNKKNQKKIKKSKKIKKIKK